MDSTRTIPLRDLLDAAIEGAYLAGKRTLAYFNTGVAVERKSDQTPVTIADREAEQLLRQHIARHFPGHAILGEEEGETDGTAPYRWVIDPIDGTKSFVAGVPLYGVLIGVEVRGVPQVGVIYLPALDEMIAAANGRGCTWNGRPCRVSPVDNLADALVVTSSIVRCQERGESFDTLAAATRLQRTWGDAFGYAMVATGRAEVMLDPALSPWDCAPMPTILREAGGRFTDWQGDENIYSRDGFAANGALHAQVLEILRAEKGPER